MKRENLRALLTTLALALSAPTPSFAQDAEKKSQEQRIQELEAQVTELQAEHEKAEPAATGSDAEDQEAARAAAEEVRGMTPEQRKRWHQGLAASQPANYNAAWHIGTPKRYVDDKGWWGLKGTPTELRLSGWVQFALFHDFQGNALATKQEFSSGAVIVPTLKRPSTGVDVGSSRIFLEFRHLFDWKQKRKNFPGVTHVLFEMDLGGDLLVDGLGPRVRQFFAQIGHLTFGQADSAFTNGGTWPADFDNGAPGAYPDVRTPVLRYAAALSKRQKKHAHVLTTGIEFQRTDFTNATSAFNAPDMVLRYDYSPDWGNLMAAVIVRYFIAESTLIDARASKWVAGGTLSGWATIPTKNEDRLKWNFLIGPGVSGLMYDTSVAGGLDGTYVDATNTLLTTNAWGIWAGWERPWAEKWNSLFMLSYVDVLNVAGQAPDTFSNSVTATVTLDYEPVNHLFIAVEYFYGRRVNFDAQFGQDHRLNLVFRYMMNR
jgi:hypothetical protein